MLFQSYMERKYKKTLRSGAVAARSPHKAEVVSSNLTSRNQDSGTDFFGAVGDENPSKD